MARPYRPSWDFCEKFKNKAQDPTLNFRKNAQNLENEVQDIPRPKIKTIAKAFGKELPQVKATWKSFLPTLSTKDIRRYRVPHYEVVTLELEESGYEDASQCVKMLFALDEEMRIKAGPGTVIWNNPRLKDRDDIINRLKIGLVEANRAMLAERPAAQATALLETALYFQKMTWEWWWIAEQLFRSAFNVSETINDDYQTVTIARYLYGRFLFNEMKDTNESMKLLNEVREASQEKPWNATKILGIKQDSLFRECCTLLYRAELSSARKAQANDCDLAIKACQKALKHAMESDHDEYITDATCELGKSYLRANQVKLALQNFVKYLNLSRKIPDYEGICNAYMELAFAYKELGDTAKMIEHLELFRETASRFQIPFKLAQAHYHIGHHLLSRNHVAQASSHFEFAFSLYNEMDKSVEAHQTRCIAAVSKGQEYVNQFIEQILRCGNYDTIATLNLCNWKNNRLPFWRTKKDADESCGEYTENYDVTESVSNSYFDRETSTESEIVEVQSLESTPNSISTNLIFDKAT